MNHYLPPIYTQSKTQPLITQSANKPFSHHKFTGLLIFLLVSLFGLTGLKAQAETTEQINSFTVQETLGTGQQAVINIDITVDERRDFHLVLKEDKTWRTLKDTIKPIKKSGKYHFTFDTSNLSPGRYRWDAFLTPKRKDWNDRIGETTNLFTTVIDGYVEPKPATKKVAIKNKPATKPENLFSSEDKIKNVIWPKEITTNDEQLLKIKYTITEPRDLHIKLLNSQNWEEHGAMKVSLKQSGDIALPFEALIDNFDAAKYAWVVSITEVGEPEKIVHKMGKHFSIVK